MSLVDDLLPHLRRVQSAERDLRDLSLLWQMIEASSAISCPDEAEAILPMLAQTRARFASLQARLLDQLAGGSIAELHEELAATAQCTIDILVRNLFERTADVGFLATDAVLRSFCAADAPTQAAQRPALLQRLAAYRAKYSVYDDIIVLAPGGEVLARLAAGGPAQSTDAVVAAAVSGSGHIERFGRSDLADPVDDSPGEALLYAHRIDDGAGRCGGVLVLRFRQADEMERIFTSVLDADRAVAMLLIDADGRVVASSDPAHVAPGARVRTAAPGELALTTFAGREVLAVTCRPTPYQGYAGPGWRAQALVSLGTAFRSRQPVLDDAAHLALDNAELAAIRGEVDAINADLRRVVWNGRLVAGLQGGAQARLKAVLQQINEAGTRTRDRVASAIHELYCSSLGRAHQQAQAMARLATEILDRNLYERANDCRWWALSPVLEAQLAAPDSAAGRQVLDTLLAQINSLYPAYIRLVAFDATGRVRGLSRDGAEHTLADATLDASLLHATLQLGDAQRYAVSPFEVPALGDGTPTWVYTAAVRHGPQRQLVGGIALVFDAARELPAMLQAVLGTQAGIAAFVDAAGHVLCATDASLQPGSPLALANGDAVAHHAGSTYAVARVDGAGYREFKCSDGYDNGVRAVFALRLGNQERRREALHDSPVLALPPATRSRARAFALFHIGAGRFALPAECVLEARPREGLVRAPLPLAHAAGLLEVPGPQGSRVIPVLCGRSMFGVHYAPRPTDGVVLVLALPEAPDVPLMGLRVDDVLSVADVGAEHQQPAPAGVRQHAPLLCGLLQLALHKPGATERSEVLAQRLDERLLVGLAGMAGLEAATETAPDSAAPAEAASLADTLGA